MAPETLSFLDTPTVGARVRVRSAGTTDLGSAFEDDAYARDKYAALKQLARALTPFSDSDLTRLTEAYARRVP